MSSTSFKLRGRLNCLVQLLAAAFWFMCNYVHHKPNQFNKPKCHAFLISGICSTRFSPPTPPFFFFFVFFSLSFVKEWELLCHVLIFKILFPHFLVNVCDFVFVSDFHWAYLLSLCVFKDVGISATGRGGEGIHAVQRLCANEEWYKEGTTTTSLVHISVDLDIAFRFESSVHISVGTLFRYSYVMII